MATDIHGGAPAALAKRPPGGEFFKKYILKKKGDSLQTERYRVGTLS